MEERIAKLMKSLDISREEAIQVLEDDKRIDKGEKLFELTAEQKKNAKKATATGTKAKKKPTVYKFDPDKKPKKDEEKADFIVKLHKLVAEMSENCVIVNENREISFELGENSYSLTLTKHRKAKK